jgi:hypothetical protein
MELARPRGVVFEDGFGIEFLPERIAQRFGTEKVYIKGVAEREPTQVYYVKGHTVIDPRSKRPIKDLDPEVYETSTTMGQMKDAGPRFAVQLPSAPLDPSQIAVVMTFPTARRGRREKDILSYYTLESPGHFEYSMLAGKPVAVLHYDKLTRLLEAAAVKHSWTVLFSISYPKA